MRGLPILTLKSVYSFHAVLYDKVIWHTYSHKCANRREGNSKVQLIIYDISMLVSSGINIEA